ncbi:nanos homolog 3 [Nerophis ophidion]|uniref:nanos homolog 3 n=1 Tax=Nerophis ophidion TaxID=159077 RepID=UPI002ADF3CAF|nr:nanos homolog 3 [Nerophis ophidion]
MDSNRSFQPWKDYMGLSDAVRKIICQNNTTLSQPEAVPSQAEASPLQTEALNASSRNMRVQRWELNPSCVASPPTSGAELRAPVAGLHNNLAYTPARKEGGFKGRSWHLNTPEPPSPTRMMCTFCKHNGESQVVYSSHWLKTLSGDVACPYLRRYVCPLCGASGDKAHTKRFCPKVDVNYKSVYVKNRR